VGVQRSDPPDNVPGLEVDLVRPPRELGARELAPVDLVDDRVRRQRATGLFELPRDLLPVCLEVQNRHPRLLGLAPRAERASVEGGYRLGPDLSNTGWDGRDAGCDGAPHGWHWPPAT